MHNVCGEPSHRPIATCEVTGLLTLQQALLMAKQLGFKLLTTMLSHASSLA